MGQIARMFAVAAALVAGVILSAPGYAADNVKTHRIAI